MDCPKCSIDWKILVQMHHKYNEKTGANIAYCSHCWKETITWFWIIA